jgi:catechol 2,3-dioxygenase-like lactoylglutathione lyase family enzyme
LVTLYCTGPLAKRFGLTLGDQLDDTPANMLGPWYATTLNVGARRFVVWLNALSNLTVVTPARNADFPNAFAPALEALLLRIGLPASLAAQEKSVSSEFNFVKARDRSLLGSLRDAVVRVRTFIEEGYDPEAAEDSMAEMPARAKAFLFPVEVVFERFGLPKSRLRGVSEDFEVISEPLRRRAAPVRFTGMTPILRVSSLEESIDHYVSVLGFRREWDDGQFGCVSRGEVQLFLCEGMQGCTQTWVYISVNDADALYEEYRQRAAQIRRSPVNYPWGARELHVQDLDGHVLRFGSDAVPGEPWGEWIDDQGAWWQPQADGSWVRVDPDMLN